MDDPALALQAAVFAALRDSADLAALMGGDVRVYDAAPPPDPGDADPAHRRRLRFPYLTIGDDEVLDDSTGCGAAWECFVTVHAWSRAPGRVEAKRLASAARAALDADLPLAGFRLIEFGHRDTRFLRDPDGVTTHAVLTFRYLIDPLDEE